MIAQSEIDFSGLRSNVRAVLVERRKASIAEVLRRFPATQGLGSVVGYLALGSKHGQRAGPERETVSWLGQDEQTRVASIPVIYFVQERSHELG
jgi:hypothetical protein